MTGSTTVLLLATTIALISCDDGAATDTTAAPVATVAPPTASTARATASASITEPTSSLAPTSTPATTVAVSTTAVATLARSAPGLEALLVVPTDVPLAVTVEAAARPQALCGTPLASVPIDGRATRLVDAATGTAVSSWVEVHPGPAVAETAFAELATTLGSCDWNRELAATTRGNELVARFVDSPELIAAHPSCDRAVTGGVIRTTSDEGPVERREVLIVIIRCRDLVSTLRVDLLNQAPVDQHPWIGPLLTTSITRVATASS